MVIAHVGALAGEPGILALAGTGSSILGIAADNGRVKVGGWGPIFGDEENAYGMAQNCLRAAARSFDGRAGKRPCLRLLRILLLSRLAIFPISSSHFMSKRWNRATSQRFARAAYDVAEGGDETAVEVFRMPGKLAENAAATATRLGLEGSDTRFSYPRLPFWNPRDRPRTFRRIAEKIFHRRKCGRTASQACHRVPLS